MSKLKVASVLAFERNLEPSEAFFSQKKWDDDKNITPVIVHKNAVRCTISNRVNKNIDTEIIKSNPQAGDAAYLDSENDTLVVDWTLKILAFTGEPCVCNDFEYKKKLMQTIKSYINEHGLKEIAKRYAINIANARWLWRNRLGSSKIKVKVTHNKDDMNFDAKQFNLNSFEVENENINKLTNIIEEGLLSNNFTLLNIKAEVFMGAGQQVFPSQELTADKGSKDKLLFKDNNNKAGFHSQKIGNALRTIDNWYTDAQFPISVEPYGQVTTIGHAFRNPNEKRDFYKLFDKWVLNDQKPEEKNDEHYVIANLIRGGVFGKSSKK